MKKNKIFGNVHNMHHSMNFWKTNFMYLIVNIRTIEIESCVWKKKKKKGRQTYQGSLQSSTCNI
jgi:hypothetical protein